MVDLTVAVGRLRRSNGGRAARVVQAAVAAGIVLVACTTDENGSHPTTLSNAGRDDPRTTTGSSDRTVPGGTASSVPAVRVTAPPDPIVPDVGSDAYDVVGYRWDLTIDPTVGSLRAHGLVDAVAASDLDEVTLDYSGAPLASVRSNGVDVVHSYTGTKLVVETDQSAGDRFQLAYVYDGTPEHRVAPGRAGRFGWIAQNDVVHTEAVLPGDMATILPLNDTPRDPATYSLEITVPAGYVATASGRLADVRDQGGQRTFSWRVDRPASEVTLSVGDYVVERVPAPELGAEISVALAPDDVDRLDDFAVVPDIIDFLEERLGPFPYEEVGFTLVDGLGAAGDSTPGRIHLAHTGEVGLVHELAHQWMGGLVGTTSTTDVWLREGFPRFVEMLWLDATGGAELDALVADGRSLLGNATRPPLEVTEAMHRSDDVTYERGALTFHALYAELGAARFWRSMATFFDEYTGTSASTDDFIDTVERVSERRLDDLFDAWLRGSVLPSP